MKKLKSKTPTLPVSTFQNQLTMYDSVCENYNHMLIKASSSLKIESEKKIWLNTTQASEYLNISVKTLLNLTSTGQVPYHKFGRLNRYRTEELDSVMIKG